MNEPRPSRVRFALLYAAAWSPLAALGIASSVLTQHQAFVTALAQTLTVTSIAALIGLPVWLLSGYVEGHASRMRAALMYAGAGVLYAVIVSAGLQLAAPMSDGHVRLDLYRLMPPLLIYAVQLIAILAVRNFIRAERSKAAAVAADKARIAAESLRARAELQALRAHLDPHFLFNTLNAIAAVVETNPAQARQMLVRAGALLRRILDLGADGRDTVTVAEEMGIVSEYVSFERLRMGDRLRVETAITDDALDCAIPAFVIQPLVENAIRHGLFPLPSGGVLRVAGSVDDGRLTLEISDTGAGADARTVAGAPGFGLRAARQRIAGAYGDAARVDVTTAPGVGFSVRLTVPAQWPEAKIHG